jgi:hypothetical protein
MMANTNLNTGTNTGTTGNTNTATSQNQRPDQGSVRSQVEHTAEAVRDKLSSTLDSLEQKGQELFGVDVRDEVNKHPLAAALVAGSVVLTIASGIGLYAFLSHRRKQSLLEQKWNMLKQLWKDPQKLFS